MNNTAKPETMFGQTEINRDDEEMKQLIAELLNPMQGEAVALANKMTEAAKKIVEYDVSEKKKACIFGNFILNLFADLMNVDEFPMDDAISLVTELLEQLKYTERIAEAETHEK